MSLQRKPAARLAHSLITLRPEPGRAARAVGWVIPVAVGLIVASLIFGPTHGAMGLIGAMAAGAGREEPLGRRVRMLLGVGLTTIAGQAIGIVLAPYHWLLPPLITGLTLLIVWTWHALLIGPPGPINTLFSAAFGTFLGSSGFTLTTVMPITATAWAVAALTSVIIISLNPNGPGRAAVAAAHDGVDAYLDRSVDLPTRDVNRMRSAAYLAVFHAWHVLRSGRPAHARALTTEGRELETELVGIHQKLIRTLQAEAFPSARPETVENLPFVPLGRPPARYLLATALDRGSRPVLVAVRAALAVLLASSMMIASPVGHPYWAILSALIVLHMGASRADLTIRAAHRVVGTGIGVLAYFGIISLDPAPWVRIGIVVAAIYGLESLVTRNYAIGVVCVTIFALLMTPTTSSGQIYELMRDRFVETVIGVSAAVLVIWLVGRRAPVLLVRSQYRRTLRAMLAVLGDLGRGDLESMTTHRDRRDLVFEVERAGALLSAQRPDDPVELASWLPVQAIVARFGFDVMAACWRPSAGPDAVAARSHDELAALIDSLPPISSSNIAATDLAARIEAIHHDFIAGLDDPARPEKE